MLPIISFVLMMVMQSVRCDPRPINSIPMTVINKANNPIELFWMGNGDLVRQTEVPIQPNGEANINSYDTHKFVAKFVDGNPDQTQTIFAKGPHKETISIYWNASHGLSNVQYSKYDEFSDKVMNATKKCQSFDAKLYSECLSKELYQDIGATQRKIEEVSHYRDLISGKLRNYTCSDEKANATTPASTRQMKILGRSLEVQSLLEMAHARIWTVPNFVTDEECDILINHARPLLTRATVAADNGSNIYSDHRRAQQASYDSHEVNGRSDPLWNLYQRIFGFINANAQMRLSSVGQEGFTIIQYNPGDEYMPHCDGDCAGEAYTPRGRVATAVLYCRIPEKGGATTFSKADIYIKPKKGMATFFSYKGSDGFMDTGYTEHSGCPVVEGEKWIATVWMREGVSKDNPWYKYDPSGHLLTLSATDGEDNATDNGHDEL